MQGMFDDVTVTAIRIYDESQLTANYTISQRGPYILFCFDHQLPVQNCTHRQNKSFEALSNIPYRFVHSKSKAHFHRG